MATKTVLTKRGKRVRNFFITLVVLAVVWWLFDITTPPQCKHKPISELSQGCIDLLYP